MLRTATGYAQRFTGHLLDEASKRFSDLPRQLVTSLWTKRAWYARPEESKPFPLSGKIAQDLIGIRRGRLCCLRSAQKAVKFLVDAGAIVWTGLFRAGARLYRLAHPEAWFLRRSHETTVLVAPFLSTIRFKIRGSDHCTELSREKRSIRASMSSQFSRRANSTPSRIQPTLHRDPSAPRDRNVRVPRPPATPASIPKRPDVPPAAPEPAAERPLPVPEHPDSESFHRIYRRHFELARERETFPYEPAPNPKAREAERRKVHTRLAALEQRGHSSDALERVLKHVVERAAASSYAAEMLASHKILLPRQFEDEIKYLARQKTRGGSKAWEPAAPYSPPASEVLASFREKEAEQTPEKEKRLMEMISSSLESFLAGKGFSGGLR